MNFKHLVENVINCNPYMAALVVSKTGQVIFVNDAYLRFLNLPREQVIGRDIRTITPHTRTMLAIENRKEIMCYEWSVNDNYGIACSVPLYEEGEVIGAFAYSIFIDSWDKQVRDNVLSRLISNSEKTGRPCNAYYTFDSIIGNSKNFMEVKYLAQEVARYNGITILLTGESGTGKELFAQAIHNYSRRADQPFIRVNCAGIPETLLESELFGYEEGAYTGARKKGKAGKFELADNGTIFLDEIGEMPLSMQSKLLLFLQEREVERLGSNRPIKIDTRVIAATNRELENLVMEGLFRQDLYYRLNVVRMIIPPLRSRRDDIQLLADHFVDKLCRRFQLPTNKISSEAMQALKQYQWPGNVRELENVLERAMILANLNKSAVIEKRFISFSHDHHPEKTSTDIRDLKSMIGEYEKKVIRQILTETGNDKLQAAKHLGINLSSLYRKAKKYGIDPGRQ